MPVIPRGQNNGVLPKPLLWLAAGVIVVLIAVVYVRSQGRLLAIRAHSSQPWSAALSPAAMGPAVSGGGGRALSSGQPAPSARTGVVTRPTQGAPQGLPSRLIVRATLATTAEAPSFSTVSLSAPSAAVPPAPNSHPAPMPGASSATAGIKVTGIAGGRVRVAVVEIEGQSYIVGIGDRVRDFAVMAISANEVVLGRDNRTFRLPLAGASTVQTTMGGGPPAVAIPAAAPSAPAAGTPSIASPPVAQQPPAAPTVPQPTAASTVPPSPTASVTAVNVGSTGYPQQTTVPLWGVPLTPAPPNPQAIPPAATLYTPSGTSVYGFTSAPITTQSTVTQRGVTVLPVASNQQQTDTQVLPPGAVLYTPSGTSVYGITSAPITTQSEVTLRGATGLPVASNQAQSTAQVLLWPTYRVELGPISDQQGAKDMAERLAQAGFTAKIDATTAGQYTVTLIPPPQATVARGLAILKSVGADVPIKVELVP
jgi:hypothetical protein